jgi:(p)ppGpp synthase/HD superfamily hydrolase
MSHQASTFSTTAAREFAVQVHGHQRDRDGSLHIEHVARVAEAVPAGDSHQRVAWLHDVIEDSDITLHDLEERLSREELQALALLTHDETEAYQTYIERIVNASGDAGELARATKQADMLDNLRRCARDHDPAVGQYGRALAALWAKHPSL